MWKKLFRTLYRGHCWLYAHGSLPALFQKQVQGRTVEG